MNKLRRLLAAITERKFVVLPLAALAVGAGVYVLNVQAATFVSVPATTVGTPTGWVPTSNPHTLVDEGSTAVESDYVQAPQSTNVGMLNFTMSSPTNVATATQLQLRINARVQTVGGGTKDDLTARIMMGTTQIATGTITTLSTTAYGWHTVLTQSGGSWTQAELDSMRVEIDRVKQGGGSPTGQNDDLRIASVYVDVTYTENLQLEQASYRWFDNTDSTTPGSALAGIDTAVTDKTIDQPLRLRISLGVTVGSLTTSDKFRLQYKHIASGSCDATGSYQDITYVTPIRFYNNPSLSTGTAISSTGNDPVRSGVTPIYQHYAESNPLTVTQAVATGEDAIWDVSLVASNLAIESGSYCLRIADTTGAVLSSYLSTPTLSLAVDASHLFGTDYRLYSPNDSLTPGTPLDAVNSASTLSTASDSFRLRSGLTTKPEFRQITSGSSHTCAIASDNQAYCWGLDHVGQLGNGATTSDQVSPVAVDTSGVLSGKTILSISAGTSHTCAIASDNQAYCWGSDSYGKLGNGFTVGDQASPVAVDTSGVLSGKTILSISVDENHTCAIASDNQAYCWGLDHVGQLGNGATTGDQASPVAVDTSGVLAGKTAISISAGRTYTCAIASDNQAYCWGSDANGQLGNGATTGNQASPVAVDTAGVLAGKTILSISAGTSHTCAIASDNQAYCWGSDSNGQLGNGATTGDQASPVAVDTAGVLAGKTILSISAGGSHTCAIASDNQAYCWGLDHVGQLGNGATTGNQTSPVDVDTSGVLAGKTILSISTGELHTCAIASDNQAYCWGDDSYRQLGNGATTGNQASPVAVDTSGALAGKSILSTSSGSSHTCAIASDNQAYCWGSDTYNQIGNGATTGNQISPVAVDTSGVLAGKTIISIASANTHTCVIASDGQAYCWGRDTSGQLGNGATTSDQASPVAVDTSGVLAGKTILSISVGNAHTCAIASDNQAYCWGSDVSGELGNGATTGNQPSPVAVDTSGVLAGKTIQSITASGGITCAIASDNQAYCWGRNANGQLGNGAITGNQPSPVAVDTSGVLAGKTILSISVGGTFTCAIASDNQAYCWGSDANGQLGNGATTGDQVSPVAVDTSGVLAGKTFLSISTGSSYTCAVASDNQAYCWGSDNQGQLGSGATTSDQISPVAVDTSGVLAGKTILSLSNGSTHTCAIASDNQAYCWGYNYSGQLGDGRTTNNHVSPNRVTTEYRLPTYILSTNSIQLAAYSSVKTATTCELQTTGYSKITDLSLIAFADQPSVSNQAAINPIASDPITAGGISYQTFHDASGQISNPGEISGGSTGLWDLSLMDNGATAGETYCIALQLDNGELFNQYTAVAEVTIAEGSSPVVPLEKRMGGGQSVIDGIKSPLGWD